MGEWNQFEDSSNSTVWVWSNGVSNNFWPLFLWFIIVVTLPVYLLGCVLLFHTSPYWWSGGCDDELEEQMLVMATEILQMTSEVSIRTFRICCRFSMGCRSF